MSVITSNSELNPAVCRVCLAVDVRLHTIADTPLQMVYEKLTNISLHTADNRPITACYICYALLYKAGKLLLMAAKAEKALSYVFEKYSKITIESISLIDREANRMTGWLSASRAEYFDNIPPVKVKNLNEIKTEPGSEEDYTVMEFEDSIVHPQSLHEDACKNKDETHVNECEGVITTSIETPQCDTAGELVVEKKIQKDGELKKNRIEKSSPTRKRKHDSGDSRTLTDERRYQCDDSQQTFSVKGYLEKHIKQHACKKYQCDICQKHYKNPNSLKIHLDTHTGKAPYKCEICPSKFNNAANLQRHSETIHGHKTFECNICQSKFNRKDNLKLHLRVHSSDMFYECSLCKKQYKDKSNYNRHLKQHNKEKPHECNICHKMFTLLHHLKTHLRAHSDEKPFKCEHCPMSFNHQSHMRTHTRTHTGEKPFECNVCKRRFNRLAHLRSHLNIHNRQA